MSINYLYYCQYLLSNQINYTLTNFAVHMQEFSHDTINRYLNSENLTPEVIWEKVHSELQSHPEACLVFDDTVFDKRFSSKIELIRRQYNDNEHRVEQLIWFEIEEKQGKLIEINKFLKDKKIKLFRVTVSANRTEYVATNDLNQSSIDEVISECKLRWKIEEFHREIKQLTGSESCQCRRASIQKNHIACALLV